MQLRSLLPNVIAHSTLIDACGRRSQFKRALEIYLISAYEKGGQPERALEIFEEMKRQGVVPNLIRFNTLIGA